MTPIITLVAILVMALILWLYTRRVLRLGYVGLRPLVALESLQGNVGQAIESDRLLHVTLGQASLLSNSSPTTLAAAHTLDYLARDGCANGNPPLTTVGEGTILPLAQARLQHAYARADRLQDYQQTQVNFVAQDSDPFVYAGGVAATIQQHQIVSNLIMGRFGPELAFIAEAGTRQNVEPVIGTDDPTALAVASAVTDKILIGEELFAVAAYLDQKPHQIAGIQAQDFLRWVIILGIVGATLVNLLIN
jgi:hypothetical protein